MIAAVFFSFLTKIESLKFFMKMNLPIYYSHLPSKSFFPITLNTFTDTETHNVPSMSHKLPMKHTEVFCVCVVSCLCKARHTEQSWMCSPICLAATLELPPGNVF